MSQLSSDPDSLTASERLGRSVHDRGGCSMLWFILQVVAIVFVIPTMLNLWRVASLSLFSRDYAIQFYALCTPVILISIGVCLIAIWRWKRWGIYGIVALSIFDFLIELCVVPSSFSFLDIIQIVVRPVVLYFAVRDKWVQFT
jgi:hypothetical protein